MIQTKLYIGSNNTTGKLELDTIIYLLSKHGVENATIYEAKGLWLGSIEHTAIVEIITDEPKDYTSLVAILKIELAQNSILVTSHAITSILQ